jgi:hypothetical protein
MTGQRSDQLSYVPKIVFNNLDVCHIESSGSQLSLSSLFSTLSLVWTEFQAFLDTKWTPNWTPNQPTQQRNLVNQKSRSFGVRLPCPTDHQNPLGKARCLNGVTIPKFLSTSPGALRDKSGNAKAYLRSIFHTKGPLGSGFCHPIPVSSLQIRTMAFTGSLRKVDFASNGK